ncbi:hypothetical protein GCM10010271_03360 [Streptomyces kurssanovii]|nr:hypothetical protein GCM10010271_03360 [Streptomyces kurssanovii]
MVEPDAGFNYNQRGAGARRSAVVAPALGNGEAVADCAQRPRWQYGKADRHRVRLREPGTLALKPLDEPDRQKASEAT